MLVKYNIVSRDKKNKTSQEIKLITIKILALSATAGFEDLWSDKPICSLKI